MILIENIEVVYCLINGVDKKDSEWVTNFYLNEDNLNHWIDKGRLFFLDCGSTVFFFRADRDFFHLYYYSNSMMSLQKDVKNIRNADYIIVVDCIGLASLGRTVSVFIENGFKRYISYTKMQRAIGKEEILPNPSYDIVFPRLDEASIICKMFENNFDRFAEQLPTIDEMEKLITIKSVIMVREGSDIAGVLIRNKKLKTSVLMFYLVNKKYRGKGVGGALLSHYLNEYRGGIITLWVLSNNENAISVYQHYGFGKKQISDQILINKDIHYEAKSN